MTACRRICVFGLLGLNVLALAACGGGGDQATTTSHETTTRRETTTLAPTTTAAPMTTFAPKSTAVGTRSCSTIDAGPDSAGVHVQRPDDLIVGPVRLNGINIGGPGLSDDPGDGTRAQIEKVPLTVFDTPAAAVRVSVTDPHNATTIVYDDQGFDLLNARQYKFADGITSVDMPGPTACGQPAEGHVQFNGGFVTREPTCATFIVSVEGAEVARGSAPLAGGSCP